MDIIDLAPVGGILGPPANPNTDPEWIGRSAGGGSGLTLANLATANTIGAVTELKPATEHDIAGFRLYFQPTGGGSGIRFQLGLFIGPAGGAMDTPLVPPFHISMGTSGVETIDLPLNIPAGFRVGGQLRASGGNASASVSLRGEVRTDDHLPLYDGCELLMPVKGSNTTPSDLALSTVLTPNTGWQTVLDPTTRAYEALMVNPGINPSGTLPLTPQTGQLRLGLGGVGATDATLIDEAQTLIGNGNPPFGRVNATFARKFVPAGSRVALEFVGSAAGETISAQVLAFYRNGA